MDIFLNLNKHHYLKESYIETIDWNGFYFSLLPGIIKIKMHYQHVVHNYLMAKVSNETIFQEAADKRARLIKVNSKTYS